MTGGGHQCGAGKVGSLLGFSLSHLNNQPTKQKMIENVLPNGKLISWNDSESIRKAKAKSSSTGGTDFCPPLLASPVQVQRGLSDLSERAPWVSDPALRTRLGVWGSPGSHQRLCSSQCLLCCQGLFEKAVLRTSLFLIFIFTFITKTYI